MSGQGAETVAKVPARYWWAKRIALGLLAVALAVGISYWAWGRAMDRRLARVEAEIRGRGEPLELGDFVVKDLPADQNAAEKYRAAIAARVEGVVARSVLATQPAASAPAATEPPYPFDSPGGLPGPMATGKPKTDESYVYDIHAFPLTAGELGLVRKILEANEKTVALTLEARGMRGVDWGNTATGVAATKKLVWMEIPGVTLGKIRALANLLRAEALLRHQEGDEGRALDCVEGLLWLGQATRQHPTVIAGLVATAIDGAASDVVMRAAPGLKVGKGPGVVAREKVLALVRLLLAEEQERADWRRDCCGERLEMRTHVSWAGEEAAWMGGRQGPLVRGQEAEMLEYMSGYVAAAAARSWPEAQSLFPREPKWIRSDDSLAVRLPHHLNRMAMPSLNKAFELHFRWLADRRMAATALALRLYAAEHGGRWPAGLADLVPDYLERVPADPFAVDGRPIAYRPPDGAREALLYSVGANGVDDGGAITVLPPPGEALNRWKQPDYPFFLEPQARRTPEVGLTEER